MHRENKDTRSLRMAGLASRVGMGWIVLASATCATAQTLPPPPVSPTPVANYEYDAEGNPTKTVVAPGSRDLATRHGYDPLGRRTSTTNAKNGVTQFGYDLLDQLTSVTDPRNLVTQYQPTALGDNKQLTSPDTGIATSTYDAAGNLKTRTDSRGVLATYSYDALNRPTQIVYSQTGNTSRTVKFTYDQTGSNFGYGVGRLTTLASPDASIVMRYDALGQVLATSQNAAGRLLTVSYEYDSAGRVTKITYPSGRIYSFNRVNGQVQSITKTAGTDVSPLLGQIVMNALNQPQSWTWTLATPKQMYSRVYDTNGRLVRHTLGLLVRDITYDDADRVSRYTHYTAATAQPAPAYDQSFGYDDLDRLISVTGSTNWSYGYDANGNRTASSVGIAAQGYTVPSTSNRVSALTNPVRSFDYDAAGNTVGDTQAGSSANYTATYSVEGRLASMKQGSTAGVEFIYDALGRRVSRSQWTGAPTNPRTVTIYAYDQENHLLGEYNADGSPAMEYIWLGDIPVAMIKLSGPTATHYAIYTDHLNTPRVILDNLGQVRWRWMGEPFGASPAEEQPMSGFAVLQQSLRFPGQLYEPFGGRHYNHFRDYDPTTGRYVQSDPIGLAGGLNTYAYVGGNPVSLTDPLGLVAATMSPSGGPGSGGGGGGCDCGELKRNILRKYGLLLAELRAYDPVLDGKGGFPMRGGKLTKPGGHFQEINDLRQGIKNDIARYNKECRDKDDGSGGLWASIPRSIDADANRPVAPPVIPSPPNANPWVGLGAGALIGIGLLLAPEVTIPTLVFGGLAAQ